MATPVEENLELQGPSGPLEASLTVPAGTPRGSAVVCHPHPLFDGTMQNKVVHTLVRTFAGAGFATLRFNFRGVGKSAGAYDEGIGETDDALAAVAYLGGRFDSSALWLAGFSFGAFVALRASTRMDCSGLVLVAPPAGKFDFTAQPLPACPTLVVQGDADDVAPPDDAVEWVNATAPGPELVVLEGVGHFFHGRLNQLRNAVSEFIDHA